jgi:hypothetical protein
LEMLLCFAAACCLLLACAIMTPLRFVEDE